MWLGLHVFLLSMAKIVSMSSADNYAHCRCILLLLLDDNKTYMSKKPEKMKKGYPVGYTGDGKDEI